MEKQSMMKLQERIVKSFLDVLILAQLKKEPKSAYDVITNIHKKFHLLLSTGTVYANMYSLERDKLIEAHCPQRKRVYMLTDKGKKTIEAIINSTDKTLLFMTDFLKDLGK